MDTPASRNSRKSGSTLRTGCAAVRRRYLSNEALLFSTNSVDPLLCSGWLPDILTRVVPKNTSHVVSPSRNDHEGKGNDDHVDDDEGIAIVWMRDIRDYTGGKSRCARVSHARDAAEWGQNEWIFIRNRNDDCTSPPGESYVYDAEAEYRMPSAKMDTYRRHSFLVPAERFCPTSSTSQSTCRAVRGNR